MEILKFLDSPRDHHLLYMLCISGNKGQVLKGIYLLNTFFKICDMWAPSDLFFSFSDWSWEWSVLWWLCFFKELTDWENGLTKIRNASLGKCFGQFLYLSLSVFFPNCAVSEAGQSADGLYNSQKGV